MAEWSFLDIGEVVDENGEPVAQVIKTEHGPLIAAAPDLLAALHECEAYLADREDVIDGDYGEPAPNKEMTLLIEVRAAIAKAEGRS